MEQEKRRKGNRASRRVVWKRRLPLVLAGAAVLAAGGAFLYANLAAFVGAAGR